MRTLVPSYTVAASGLNELIGLNAYNSTFIAKISHMYHGTLLCKQRMAIIMMATWKERDTRQQQGFDPSDFALGRPRSPPTRTIQIRHG